MEPRKLINALLIALLALTIIGCANSGIRQAEPGEIDTADDLAAALREKGMVVELGTVIDQPYFEPDAQVLAVNGEQLQVFEFADGAAAADAAETVSEDGTTIGTTSISWIGPPHVYRAGNLIAIHVGEDTAVRDALNEIMGPQFAGE
jgi:hypothetical protein